MSNAKASNKLAQGYMRRIQGGSGIKKTPDGAPSEGAAGQEKMADNKANKATGTANNMPNMQFMKTNDLLQMLFQEHQMKTAARIDQWEPEITGVQTAKLIQG